MNNSEGNVNRMNECAGLRVDGRRLEESIRALGRMGASPAGGVTRLALSDADREARDLLVSWFRGEGLDVRVDAVGNIFAVRSGVSDFAPVVMGSHIDTVRDGGIFDGALGVLGALEVVRALNEGKVETRTPVAVAVF